MSDRPRVAVAGFVFLVARGVSMTVSFRQHREFLLDYLRPQRPAAAGLIVLLFRADWRVGIVYSVFTVTALVILRRLIESAVPYWKEARQTSAILLGFLEERLSGTEDIRASGAVPYVMRRLYEALRNQLDKSRRAWLRGTMMWATTAGLLAVGNAIAFGMGAYLLRQGVSTLGTVYLLFHYTELLRRPLEQITRQIQELQRASASISRVGDLFALGTATKDGPRRLPAGPLGVDVDRAAFGYVEGDLVLEDISVHLAPGRVWGLLGRTGRGKTTAGRLFVRFYDPTAGAIRLGGTDIRDVPLADLRNRVGLVTQDVQLFHASVRENLTFFNPGISDARIMEVLHALGLVEWMESLPHGLDTQIGPRALSAGEAQLLAFARAFFKDPGLVILDEASSRLDPATDQLVERAVGALLRGRTAVIIPHRLATVQRADEIMILDGGRVIEYGPRAALAADPASRFASLLRTGMEEVLA